MDKTNFELGDDFILTKGPRSTNLRDQERYTLIRWKLKGASLQSVPGILVITLKILKIL